MRLIIIATDLADKEREIEGKDMSGGERLFVVKKGHKKGCWLAKKDLERVKYSERAVEGGSIETILSIRYIKRG